MTTRWGWTTAGAVVTGISEEEDAARHMAREFNPVPSAT